MNEFENEKTMNKEFATWKLTYSCDEDDRHGYNIRNMQAAFLAGADVMKERCVEVCETVEIQCTNEHTDYCTGWNASICPDKSTAFCAAAAIRKLEVE